MIKLTYFLDVVSSWCYYVEPVWSELKEEYSEEIQFEWKTALIPPEGLPSSALEEDYYYRRSGIITKQQKMLNSGWMDTSVNEYLAPNAVAVAAKNLGVKGDEVRLAITKAAVLEGKLVSTYEACAEIATTACDLSKEDLVELCHSELVEQEVRADTKLFHSFGINQRPAFHLESEIEDRAIFSGLIHKEPLVATIEAMISDVKGYRSWDAHFSNTFPG